MLDEFEGHGALPVIMCGDMNARTGHLQSQLDVDGISDPDDHMSDTAARGRRMTVQHTFWGGSSCP